MEDALSQNNLTKRNLSVHGNDQDRPKNNNNKKSGRATTQCDLT